MNTLDPTPTATVSQTGVERFAATLEQAGSVNYDRAGGASTEFPCPVCGADSLTVPDGDTPRPECGCHWSDVLDVLGLDADLAALTRPVADVIPITRTRRNLRSYLYTPQALERLEDPEWLVRGVLVRDSIGMLYGQPGARKSFLALDWAFSLAAGVTEWHGRAMATAPTVLYVAPEGARGVKKRQRAWEVANGVKVPNSLAFLTRAVNVLDQTGQDWAELTELVREAAPALIVVDTLARCAEGGDENSAKDMGRFVAGVDTLREASGGACVLLVHHSTKAGDGFRGSSALSGAADTMLELKADGTLRCEKQKDAEPFEPIHLQPYDVPGTESCVLVEGDLSAATDTLTVRRVRNALEGFGGEGASSAELVKDTDLSKPTVLRAVDALGDLVENIGTDKRPRYRLAMER